MTAKYEKSRNPISLGWKITWECVCGWFHCVLDSCLIKRNIKTLWSFVALRLLYAWSIWFVLRSAPQPCQWHSSWKHQRACRHGSSVHLSQLSHLKYGCVWKLSILRIPGYPWNDNFSWEHDFQPLDLGLTYTIQTLTENHSPLGKKYRCLDKRMKDLFPFGNFPLPSRAILSIICVSTLSPMTKPHDIGCRLRYET